MITWVPLLLALCGSRSCIPVVTRAGGVEEPGYTDNEAHPIAVHLLPVTMIGTLKLLHEYYLSMKNHSVL